MKLMEIPVDEKKILGDCPVLTGVRELYAYDSTAKRYTDELIGYAYTVQNFDAEEPIIVEVRVAGGRQVSRKGGELPQIGFEGLDLHVQQKNVGNFNGRTKYEYVVAGTATRIFRVQHRQEQQV